MSRAASLPFLLRISNHKMATFQANYSWRNTANEYWQSNIVHEEKWIATICLLAPRAAFKRKSRFEGLDPVSRAGKYIPDPAHPWDCQKELEPLWFGKRHFSWWQEDVSCSMACQCYHTPESYILQMKDIIPPRKTAVTPQMNQKMSSSYGHHLWSVYMKTVKFNRLEKIKKILKKNLKKGK